MKLLEDSRLRFLARKPFAGAVRIISRVYEPDAGRFRVGWRNLISSKEIATEDDFVNTAMLKIVPSMLARLTLANGTLAGEGELQSRHPVVIRSASRCGVCAYSHGRI